MASRTEWLKIFAGLTGQSFETLKQYGKELVKAKMLKSIGRGPHALAISPGGAARLFLAIAGGGRINHAAAAVKKLEICTSVDGYNLFERLLEIFKYDGLAEQIDEIRVCQTHPETHISFKEDHGPIDERTGKEYENVPIIHRHSEVFRLPDDYQGEPGEIGKAKFNTWSIIEGSVIHKLSLAISTK